MSEIATFLKDILLITIMATCAYAFLMNICQTPYICISFYLWKCEIKFLWRLS